MLEWADRDGVAGWAAAGAVLEVFAAGRLEAVVVADQYRPDLPDDAAAFAAWFDQRLPPGAVAVAVRLADGRHLPGSPCLLPAETAPAPGAWRADAGRPLALVVDSATPDPARDAGSVALLRHMAALERLGYAVRFAPLAEADAAIAATAGRVRVAWLHRLRAAARTQALRAANPGVRVVFSLADLAHLRAARQAAVLGGVAPAGLRRAELAAAGAADVVVTHSPVEAALLARALPGRRCHVVPWDMAPLAPPAFAARQGVAFLGSYGHAPNLDAARLLLEAVMPLVWREAAIPLVLAGHGMPRWLAARRGALVRVVDSLPDTAALWRQVRLSAAPLRFGAGIKGKVLDSLAAGIPCVCAPVAAEGLALPPSLLADDVAGMARLIGHLHDDARANAAAAWAARGALAGPAEVTAALAAALA